MDNDDLLLLKLNRETLQDSKIAKVISKNLVRKAIEIMRKLAEKDESKKDKDNNNIDDKTKEVEINDNREVAETENYELVVDATNDNPPPQYAPTTTTTTAAAAEGGGYNDDDVSARDG